MAHSVIFTQHDFIHSITVPFLSVFSFISCTHFVTKNDVSGHDLPTFGDGEHFHRFVDLVADRGRGNEQRINDGNLDVKSGLNDDKDRADERTTSTSIRIILSVFFLLCRDDSYV